MSAPARRLPLLTLGLVGASLALLAAPEVAARLHFERARLAVEPWRFLLGHLVHERSLAGADLALLAVLGAWWELRSRAAWAWILLASGVSASVALLAFTPFASYTGSSALSSGLFAAAALALALETRGGWRLAAGLALLAFCAKCALEAAGSGALFVALPAGTEVAAQAHGAGGAGGALVALVRHRSERRRGVAGA